MLNTILANWKTSVVGTVSALLSMLQVLGVVHLTAEQIASIVGFLVALGFIFSKDGNVTGGTTPQ